MKNHQIVTLLDKFGVILVYVHGPVALIFGSRINYVLLPLRLEFWFCINVGKMEPKKDYN